MKYLIVLNIAFLLFIYFSVDIIQIGNYNDILLFNVLTIYFFYFKLLRSGLKFISLENFSFIIINVFSVTSVIIYIIAPKIVSFFWVKDIFSELLFFKASILNFIALSSIILGLHKKSKGLHKKSKLFYKDNSFNQLRFERLFKFLYFSSFLIILIETIRGYGIPLNLDYAVYSEKIYTGGLSKIFLANINYLLPLFSFVIISSSTSKKDFILKSLKFALLPILFAVLVGDRDVPIGVFISLLLIFKIKINEKISIRKMLVPTLLLIFLMVQIGNFRNSDFTLTTKVYQSEQYSTIINSTIFDAFLRQSSTMSVFVGTLKELDRTDDFRFGLDYIRSFFTGIPFAQSAFDLRFAAKFAEGNSRPTEWITNIYHKDRGSGLGYYIFAEAYLQYGVLGIILFPYFFILLVKKINYKLFSSNSSLKIAFYLFLFMGIIGWIRNDIYVFSKFFWWGLIICFLIPSFLTKAKK